MILSLFISSLNWIHSIFSPTIFTVNRVLLSVSVFLFFRWTILANLPLKQWSARFVSSVFILCIVIIIRKWCWYHQHSKMTNLFYQLFYEYQAALIKGNFSLNLYFKSYKWWFKFESPEIDCQESASSFLLY